MNLCIFVCGHSPQYSTYCYVTFILLFGQHSLFIALKYFCCVYLLGCHIKKFCMCVWEYATEFVMFTSLGLLRCQDIVYF